MERVPCADTRVGPSLPPSRRHPLLLSDDHVASSSFPVEPAQQHQQHQQQQPFAPFSDFPMTGSFPSTPLTLQTTTCPQSPHGGGNRRMLGGSIVAAAMTSSSSSSSSSTNVSSLSSSSSSTLLSSSTPQQQDTVVCCGYCGCMESPVKLWRNVAFGPFYIRYAPPSVFPRFFWRVRHISCSLIRKLSFLCVCVRPACAINTP